VPASGGAAGGHRACRLDVGRSWILKD
jgi:hypothetical protein